LVIIKYQEDTSNQEDSLIVSQGAVDRGLFNGCKFTFYKDELEQREDFGNPDVTTTTNIKSGSYAKLTDGIIKVGTKINKGDAIIGKYMRIPKTADQEMTMSDRSTIYKENEEAIVHNVIIDRNEDDERFAKVALRKVRPVTIGDKFCLTPDHEVLTTTGWKEIDKVSVTDKVATLNPENHNIEYHNPTDVPCFDHDGKMYSVQAHGVDLVTTLNHKMYVRLDNTPDAKFESIEAKDIYGKEVYYKKDGNNVFDKVKIFTLPAYDDFKEKHLDMSAWLKFWGIYLNKGYIIDSTHIKINISNQTTRVNLFEILYDLKISFSFYETDIDYLWINNEQIASYLKETGTKLPSWCYTMDIYRSNDLFKSLVEHHETYSKNNRDWRYNTNSKDIVDSLQILSIMCGYSSRVITQFQGCKESKTNADYKQYKVIISSKAKDKIPLVGGKYTKENLVDYNGNVYCLTVPNHLFMVRRNNKCVWTSNSSRAGQKGVVGITLRDSDMPFTKSGMRPSIIMNPHQLGVCETAMFCKSIVISVSVYENMTVC